MEKANDEILKIEKDIKRVLKEQGVYSELLDYAIRDCAQITYLKNEVLSTIQGESDIVITEVTRENNERVKISPAVVLIQDLLESSRKALVELGMTARKSASTEGDEIDKLTSEVSRARRSQGGKGEK